MKKLQATKPLRLATSTVRALQSVDLITVAAGVEPQSRKNGGHGGCGASGLCETV